jgi:hypothetical protein
VNLTPGSFAFGPMGVPHTFVAETEGAKFLVGLAPVIFRRLHQRGREARAGARSAAAARRTAGHGGDPAHGRETRLRHPRTTGTTTRAIVTRAFSSRAGTRGIESCRSSAVGLSCQSPRNS